MIHIIKKSQMLETLRCSIKFIIKCIVVTMAAGTQKSFCPDEQDMKRARKTGSSIGRKDGV